MLQLVVARYNEDVQWTKQFDDVVIYNKGAPLHMGEIPLPNVGREAHTYFKHICDNYDNLAEYTAFVQGHPFDHSPNIIKNLKEFKGGDFTFLSEQILKTQLKECPHHKNLCTLTTYEKLFDDGRTDVEYTFGAGAQFIVSRKRILERPKSFYEKVLELNSHDVCPIESYHIERLNSFIFGWES